jgi:hypothetical protein
MKNNPLEKTIKMHILWHIESEFVFDIDIQIWHQNYSDSNSKENVKGWYIVAINF